MSEQPGRTIGTNGRSSRQRPKGGWLYLLGALALAAAGLLLVRLVRAQKGRVQGELEARRAAVQAGPRVQVVTVGTASPEHTLTLLGEANPYLTATLYGKVSGYLKEVRVDKGDRVQANQVLAVIESPELDHQYQSAVADAHNKRVNAERADTLVKQDMISRQDADQADTEAKVAEANVAALATLKSYEILRAPFDGVITARYADPGALVQNAENSQTSALAVVTVSTIDRLRVYVYAPQRDAPFVRVGTPVEVTLPDQPGVKLTASVTRTTEQLDPKTRTLLTEIDFWNRDRSILPGSFVNVSLRIRAPAYVEVPAQALVMRENKPFVVVVSENNRVNFRPVTIADDDGQTVRVLSGLNKGERIALNPGDSVGDGDRVQPVAAQ